MILTLPRLKSVYGNSNITLGDVTIEDYFWLHINNSSADVRPVLVSLVRMLGMGVKHTLVSLSSVSNHNLSVKKDSGLLRYVCWVPAAVAVLLLLLEGGLHLITPQRDSHDLPAPAHG